MPVKVNAETCVGCGACCGVCPSGALSLNGEGKAQCDGNTCVDCGACVGTCPTSSITQ